jgi:hypothetical protein
MRKAKLLMAVTFLLISGSYAQTITNNPALVPPQTLCQNTASTPLTVTATGTGLIYQWYSNTSASYVGATAIPGANAATYTPSTASDGSFYYYCWVIAATNYGGRTWMNQNLNVDHYRNGDSIMEVSSPGAWVGLTTGAWCHVDGNAANDAIYGKLYNWYAVNDSRGLAPYGWHIPSVAEFNSGGDVNFQNSFSTKAGYRETNGKYYHSNKYGNWWTRSQESAGNKTAWFFQNGWKQLLDYKILGMSVRCIKD